MRRGAFICCAHDMRRLFATPRAWAVCALLLLLIDNTLQPIRFMLAAEHQLVSWPGMLLYLLNDSQVTMMAGLLVMMLMFDVPMTDETQKYIIVRTGRANWAVGHVLYILAAVASFVVLYCLFTLLLLAPYIDWTGGWGSGLIAFVEGGMYEVYDSMLNYDPWLMRVYGPLSGGLMAVGLKFLGYTMLALLMCAANVAFRTRLGFIAAAVPLVVDSVADEYFSVPMYYFTPMSLTRPSFLDYGDEMGRPPVLYGVIVLVALCAGLSALVVHLCRRREIRL